jgi:hypothetical protein
VPLPLPFRRLSWMQRRVGGSAGHGFVRVRRCRPRVEKCNARCKKCNDRARGHTQFHTRQMADADALFADKLLTASRCADARAMRALLTQVPAPVPDDPECYTEALVFASRRGHAAIVRLLLEDGRADPAAGESQALCAAVGHGSVDVVQLLLSDGRAEPAARDCQALIVAANSGDADVVRLLLADGRSDPTARGNFALWTAVMYCYATVVQLLVEDGRADPEAAWMHASERHLVFPAIRWRGRRRWLRAGAR